MPFHTTPDSNTKFLLHSDTSNDSTTFVDSSTANITITAESAPAHKTAYSKFGKTSIFFDGSNDYLRVPHADNFPLGGAARTIDCWIYQHTAPTAGYYFSYGVGGSNNTIFGVSSSSGNWYFQGYGAADFATGVAIVQNQWHHIAVTHDGTTTVFYLNGVSIGSEAHTLITAGTTLIIGGSAHGTPNEGNEPQVCHIDEFRVSDIVRWTGNFIPPNSPYDKVDRGFVTNVRQLSHDSMGKGKGGEVHHRSDKIIHVFKSSGIFQLPRAITDDTCDIVVVGAGAAGSIDHGGGGGAGAIGYKTGYSLAAGRYAVTVGAGGVAGTGNHGTGVQGGSTTRMFALSAPGRASSFGSLIVAYGGQGAQGCCGTATLGGGAFGCGGGALRCNNVVTTDKGTTTISATLLAYMSTAGTGANIGGGGGGAGAAGANSSTGTGGNGARPVTWADAWGTDTNNDVGGGYFAGGGAGGSHTDNPVTEDTLGGYGGGGGWGDTGFGNTENSDIFTGKDGMANTGGGGTGVANPYPASATTGAGGSGIVLIKYNI